MEVFEVKHKQYEIVSLLKEDVTHKTYLTKYKDRNFVIKTFSSFMTYSEMLSQYLQLKKYGIKMPKLIKKDKKYLNLVFEYIPGENMLQVVSKNDVDEKTLDQLFNMYRFARFSKIDIDYMPENFVLYNNELYYMSYFYGPSNSQKNLENYGIRYWIYTKELAEHLLEKGFEVDKKRILSNAEANKKIVLLSIMRW